jgi:hypothetical protein
MIAKDESGHSRILSDRDGGCLPQTLIEFLARPSWKRTNRPLSGCGKAVRLKGYRRQK